MSSIMNPNDDESFIILGSSPGTSLDAKCNGLLNGEPLNKDQLEDALKDMSDEANQAFKAHFKLGDCPSLASMMVASNIVTDDKSTGELQKRFGELVDENTILKETLKQNNDSMKEQFLLIASCQDDMMKTHMMHKEKFDETRELVERLRQENKKLKLDIVRLANNESLSGIITNQNNGTALNNQTQKNSLSSAINSVNSLSGINSHSATTGNSQPGTMVNSQPGTMVNSQPGTMVNSLPGTMVDSQTGITVNSQSAINGNAMSGSSIGNSGPSSALEFVTSPDDDTINKLTQQLELVEKQRRQVIVENEKLSWQKESLEHIVDATSRERDDLKEKLKQVELKLSSKDSEHLFEMSKLKTTIQELHKKLESTNNLSNVTMEDIKKRDMKIKQLESKIPTLQNELKTSQLRILELENVKLEFSRYKSSLSETVRGYKEQLHDMHNKLKEAQTLVFQPVRLSVSVAGQTSDASQLNSNLKTYDTALKHLSDYLNAVTDGTSDSIMGSIGLVSSLQDVKLDRLSVDQYQAGLHELKINLDKQHRHVLTNIGQIRSCLQIFEGVLKDCNEVINKQQNDTSSSASMLSAALVSRDHELQQLREQLQARNDDKEQCDLLRAQLDIYKCDFEAERSARSQLAGERDAALTQLRAAEKKIQALQAQLNAAGSSPKRQISSPSSSGPSSNTSTGTTGNTVYKCPKCMRFSTDQYKVMEDHFDFCLDDF